MTNVVINSISSSPPYTLTSLKDETEIQKWSEFCASCFSDKKPIPPPSSYFSRHFFNDPMRDARLVFVIKQTNNNNDQHDQHQHHNNKNEKDVDHDVIVASTRVFLREISLGHGNTCWAGGIGEVCTDPNHRNKGLAKHLLHCAIEAMQVYEHGHDKGKLQCSLLHASPTLMKVYETSSNYKGVTTHWTVLPLNGISSNNNNISTKLNIRLASFPKDTFQLQRIHKEYSEDRFVGCIIRSREYWNEYLSKEIGDSMFVLYTRSHKKQDTDNTDNNYDNDKVKILSWMSLKVRSDTRIQLRDFGCCRKSCMEENISMVTVFSMLLGHTLARTTTTMDGQPAFLSSCSSLSMELAIPSVVYQELKSSIHVNSNNNNNNNNHNNDNDEDQCECEEKDNHKSPFEQWLVDLLLSEKESSSSSSYTSTSSSSFSSSSFAVKEECDPGWMYKNLRQQQQQQQEEEEEEGSSSSPIW
eukprot:CAMPEP_0176487194 /NCGR_PEP_ID=MMETSP0200_2-20121128/5988_1 /TAXON_ID=947934 /ORGANISM="Chaetoceros sp., Strain GSL56" /LENGTH=469 /DNA_ID=CAMNT_0017883979 /DNA_START=31 /DNA_END=1437 /DNA_ORIENTATION=+